MESALNHTCSPETSLGTGPAGVLGLADELGLVLAEGLIEGEIDDEGDWLKLTLELGLSDELGEIDALAEAEGLNEGEVEELGLTLGLALELALALGDIDALGLGLKLAAPIDAQTFTPFVTPVRE